LSPSSWKARSSFSVFILGAKRPFIVPSCRIQNISTQLRLCMPFAVSSAPAL
jgi:hypothetical protein